MKNIGAAAGMVIMNKKRELLLMKRSKNTRNDHGMWSIPGGKIEFGEKAKDAAIRETMEECGVEVLEARHLGYIDHILQNEDQHWIPQIFLAEKWVGQPQNLEPEKCDEIGWFSLENIPENSSQVVVDSVKLLNVPRGTLC